MAKLTTLFSHSYTCNPLPPTAVLVFYDFYVSLLQDILLCSQLSLHARPQDHLTGSSLISKGGFTECSVM